MKTCKLGMILQITSAIAILGGCAGNLPQQELKQQVPAPVISQTPQSLVPQPLLAPAAPPVEAPTPAKPKDAQIADPTTGMQLLLVKGGCYMMGANDGPEASRPAHQVCLSDFYIGKYEVTQGQWQAVMGSNASSFKECGSECPVESVSWVDIQQFIKTINAKSGREYRLPSEAEWEYAARSGGKDETYAGTSDDKSLGNYSWYRLNSDNVSHPVGRKKPNGLGVYDMSGNVYEWCQDWYKDSSYSESAKDNPMGPGNGAYRVLRGGSWEDDDRSQRTIERGRDEPDGKGPNNGFRLVLPAP